MFRLKWPKPKPNFSKISQINCQDDEEVEDPEENNSQKNPKKKEYQKIQVQEYMEIPLQTDPNMLQNSQSTAKFNTKTSLNKKKYIEKNPENRLKKSLKRASRNIKEVLTSTARSLNNSLSMKGKSSLSSMQIKNKKIRRKTFLTDIDLNNNSIRNKRVSLKPLIDSYSSNLKSEEIFDRVIFKSNEANLRLRFFQFRDMFKDGQKEFCCGLDEYSVFLLNEVFHPSLLYDDGKIQELHYKLFGFHQLMLKKIFRG